MLYEVAVLKKPTKKEAEDGATEELVFGPKAVTGRDPQSAAIKAVTGATNLTLTDNHEVLVRPFA